MIKALSENNLSGNISISEMIPLLKSNCNFPADVQGKQLLRSIAEDDLVIMRRYENPERYLESFESAALKIRDPESTRPINGNLTGCPFGDEEEYEDDEDIYDDECSETEQQEQTDKPADSPGEQQEEWTQLTLL